MSKQSISYTIFVRETRGGNWTRAQNQSIEDYTSLGEAMKDARILRRFFPEVEIDCFDPAKDESDYIMVDLD